MTASSGTARNLRSDILFAFMLVFACYLAWVVRDVLMLAYVSALFAVVLTPVVRFTSRIRIGHWRPFRGSIAIFALLLGVVAAIAAFCFLSLPPVIRDLQEFGKEMPTRLPGMLQKLKSIPFADQMNADDIASRIQGYASQAATYLFLSIGDWAGKIFNIVMGFVLTVYFILEGKRAYVWFLSFFPPDKRHRLDLTLRRAEVRMGKWLIGQGSLMLILGVTSTLVYLSLHVRYAYALGVLTGFLNIIPVVGAAVCVTLAIFVAAIDSWQRVVGIAIFYVIYLQVENSLLTPRIMRNSVGLPALAILMALLLGSALEGVPGAMVSVPTAVLVAELVNEYLVVKEPVQE
jgi:predicted PurR-regulated permease PerM